jgi:hypothetical protein
MLMCFAGLTCSAGLQDSERRSNRLPPPVIIAVSSLGRCVWRVSKLIVIAGTTRTRSGLHSTRLWRPPKSNPKPLSFHDHLVNDKTPPSDTCTNASPLTPSG